MYGQEQRAQHCRPSNTHTHTIHSAITREHTATTIMMMSGDGNRPAIRTMVTPTWNRWQTPTKWSSSTSVRPHKLTRRWYLGGVHSKYLILNAHTNEEEEDDGQIETGVPPIVGDGTLDEPIGDAVQFVRYANKDERCYDNIGHRVARDEHQNAVSIGRQPNVVLTNEQLAKNWKNKSEQSVIENQP